MEGYCLTGQSPQTAVVPMEEEEEEGIMWLLRRIMKVPKLLYRCENLTSIKQPKIRSNTVEMKVMGSIAGCSLYEVPESMCMKIGKGEK
jgi:hypothetical protein